jgi:multiple sugar transport system ATP-binding protein
VRQAAEALGIDTLLERKPAQLSGGQRQRVALGRAIVREPQAFLLDEPLSNLDPQMRVSARAELALLHRRLGATMIYVTHDQEEAMTLGTSVAVMREGTIEQVAPPLDLFRRPVNAFVAGFIGAPAMNFVRGTILPGRSDGLRLASPAFTIDDVVARNESGASINNAADAVTRGEILLGVRPHDIELTPLAGGHGAGRVEIVELLGSTSVIHLRVDGLSDRLLRMVVSSDMTVAVGERVGFRIHVDRLHLFDERTGQRVNQVLDGR